MPRFKTPCDERAPNTAKICMAELLSYFLITVNEIELENVSVSDM